MIWRSTVSGLGDEASGWRGITTGNNVGVVGVEALPEGGHALTFTAHEYDAKRDVLLPGLTDRSVPQT